ncbi:glycosyltransferase family 2 protein [Flavobacterium piscis]|uniref:GT2 family glycosyltransferase n=1 Tax=Flavobacterium piscis TaxID=1114874 RepID=A0ABU1Y5K4_9FLAO|nr:glycosyltransferase family 2 protein [Flavobacterium piscis]MDR7208960.1 GT2 family glycosyltransferase [Flavobacterium piscis]
MKIFVVIVTYNAMNWIEKCLYSILNSSTPLEIIVIDNGSSDGTSEFIEANFNMVYVYNQNENLGFGAANNIGLNLALENGGDYFLLLNQDVYVKPDTVEILINAMQSNIDYGVLSPIHLNGNGDEIDLYFQIYCGPNNCKNFYSDVYLKKELKSIYELPFVNAAVWLLSRKTLEIVGGFNPYFFHYAEDNDYLNRCRYQKMKIGIVPEAMAFHDRILKNRSYDLKTFVNSNDVKLMDPNRNISVNRMLKMTLKGILKSIINTNRFYFKSNIFYLRKLIKNANLIKEYKEASKANNFTFLKVKLNLNGK